MTIAVIGLGGGGGNIANEAAKKGFANAAINFSQKDLDSLDNVRIKLKVMGSDGVGHDRELAITLVQDHFEMIVDFLVSNFSNPSIKVVVFAFATGGGSGSGIAPILIHMVKSLFEDKLIVAIPIIPDVGESTVIQMNCSATMDELSRLDIAILPIDNQQVKNNMPQIGKGKLYDTTNTYVIDMLHKIISYTEKYSKNGNFDNRDFITLFRQRGISIITEINIAQLDKTNDLDPAVIAATVQESWINSIFTPIELDFVMKAGVIFDGQEELMPFINHELIFDCFDNKMPLDLFEGNYHEQNGQFITILTGLPWIKQRIRVIDELIEKGGQKLDFALKMEEINEYKPKMIDFSSKMKQKSPENVKKSLSVLVKEWRK